MTLPKQKSEIWRNSLNQKSLHLKYSSWKNNINQNSTLSFIGEKAATLENFEILNPSEQGTILNSVLGIQKDNEKNYNPNGSTEDIAGILSNNGKVLGMMPHPERAINCLLGGTDGLKFLTNCVEHIIG